VLAPSDLLFRQGNPAAAIYKVESGRLRLIRRTVDDHLVILHMARRGELFAEASLFADAYHCDAVAAALSSVRVYPRAIVMDALRTDPALAEAFMARLARQLQELRARMELRNIRSARERQDNAGPWVPPILVDDIGQRHTADGSEPSHRIADRQQGIRMDVRRQAECGLCFFL